MCRRFAVLFVATLFLGILGCNEKPSPPVSVPEGTPAAEPHVLRLPTPPEFSEELLALVETLDEDWPGTSVAKLTQFLTRNRGYESDDVVESYIAYYRSLSKKRAHDARELARKGDFDAAEAILTDLATHLPDAPGGQEAAEHLSFGFQMQRAQHLLMSRRFEEAEVVARALLDLDLTREQAAQVEQVLDSLGQVNMALGMMERQSTEQAARQLVLLVLTRYVEEGVIPPRMTLADVQEWTPLGDAS